MDTNTWCSVSQLQTLLSRCLGSNWLPGGLVKRTTVYYLVVSQFKYYSLMIGQSRVECIASISQIVGLGNEYSNPTECINCLKTTCTPCLRVSVSTRSMFMVAFWPSHTYCKMYLTKNECPTCIFDRSNRFWHILPKIHVMTSCWLNLKTLITTFWISNLKVTQSLWGPNAVNSTSNRIIGIYFYGVS